MPEGARRRVAWDRYLGGSLAGRWRRLRASGGYAFARAFVLWFALVQFLVAFFVLDEGLAQRATAGAVAASVPLLGLEGVRAGESVTFDGAFTYVVEPGCTGVTVAGMLLAAVLAYPAGLRRRLWGVAFCLPFTFAVNLVRLDTMAWLGVHARGAFDVMHELGWETGVVLSGAAGFILWVLVGEALDAGRASVAGVRRAAGAAALFLALFAGGAWLAVLLQADVALGRAMAAATAPVGRALWGGAYPPPQLVVITKPILAVVALVGYAALFLATPGVPVRRRAWAALWGAALPVLGGAFLGTLVVGGAWIGAVGRHPLSVVVLLLANLGVPMLAWALWWSRARRARRAPAAVGPGARAAGSGAAQARRAARRSRSPTSSAEASPSAAGKGE